MYYLHREIMGAADSQTKVDHADGNTLNNQRSNLRDCSSLENNWNARRKTRAGTSRYKGVCFDKRTGRWTAEIRSGVRYRLGRFLTEIDAALAYDVKARELHGEFARTNESLGLLPQH